MPNAILNSLHLAGEGEKETEAGQKNPEYSSYAEVESYIWRVFVGEIA